MVSDDLVLATAPAELLLPTPEPELVGPRTNKTLADYIQSLRDALRSANDDKDAFLHWLERNLR